MVYVISAIILIAIILIIVSLRHKRGKNKTGKYEKVFLYDSRGFDSNYIHRNGTRFDDFGYDYFGYDVNGYNKDGYNRLGKNNRGQYDRFFDTKACEDGFYDHNIYRITLTAHARERMSERLGICDYSNMDIQAINAYRYGKSKRQIKKSSAYLVEEIEQKHDTGIVLIYRNVIYIFSCENVLITVYKNDKIIL